MALIQRYTTELSAHAASTHRRIEDDNHSVDHLLDSVAAIQRQDEDDKHYFHSLNDRLEELIHSLDQLEITNHQLREDLNSLISNWGIDGGNRVQMLNELDQFIYRLSEQNHYRSIFQAETRIFDEQIQSNDRTSTFFLDMANLYRDKCQIIYELTNELEEELRKIRVRLDWSDAQVKSHDDDYQNELRKFRSYLIEWSQLALDKQYLINDIQSLRERYNLRLAYNQEEIREWQRLLNRISQESKNYYRDYLETIKHRIQMDYEQMAKDQQMDVEFQLKSRLKEIQEDINRGVPIFQTDERVHREMTREFESRLERSTNDYDRLQNDYRIVAEDIQHKRRALQDLESELRNKRRKHIEQHTQLEQDTDYTRAEYYSLRDDLDKIAYQLRFSVEEELKIYEALLNSFQRKRVERLPIEDANYRQTSTTARYHDTISSGGESTGFIRASPTLTTETSRMFTSQTNIDDSTRYQPIPVTTETTRMFTSQSNMDESWRYRPVPVTTETTRMFTSQSNMSDSFGYRPIPVTTETTRIFTTQSNIDDSMKYRPPPPRPSPPPPPRPSPPPLPITTSETTRIITTEAKKDDVPKYRPALIPLMETMKTTTTTTKTTKKPSENTAIATRITQKDESPSKGWTYEAVTSGTTSSTRDDSTDRDRGRSADRAVVSTRTDKDRYGPAGMQESLLDQNRTTTTTTRTTRRVGRDGQQQQRDNSGGRRGDGGGGGAGGRRDQRGASSSRREQTTFASIVPDVDEAFVQSKIHITRKYKGNVLIKFVDVNGRFVEIENTGNQSRDLTGWYIERTIDGRRIEYTFPAYELPAHRSVRIYGNYHRRSSSSDDQYLQLIVPNFYDWGTGRLMRTELFNRDDIGKALFEQTIRD